MYYKKPLNKPFIPIPSFETAKTSDMLIILFEDCSRHQYPT